MGDIKVWTIVTPEYETSGGYYYEPPEYGCDVVKVRARTKREALVRGVRALRKKYPHGYLCWNDGNPFTGLKANCISDLPFIPPEGEFSDEERLEMLIEELEYISKDFDDEDWPLINSTNKEQQ